LADLAVQFDYKNQGLCSINEARNEIRRGLHSQKPNIFPLGKIGTDIGDLLSEMFSNKYQKISVETHCATCDPANPKRVTESDDNCLDFILSNKHRTISKHFSTWQDGDRTCGTCNSLCRISRRFAQNPQLMIFGLQVNISISKTIKLIHEDKSATNLHLRGIIYGGGGHFVARLITLGKDVWFHDGIATGSACQIEKPLTQFTEKELKVHKDKIAVAAIYSF
ncbi:hypothetical protein CPB83DRAFT_921983, partial [Crepidotus variabilis]